MAAQVLGARLLPPAAGSGRSARRFATGIGPSFADAPSGCLCRRALQRLLPVLEFTEGDFLAHGGGSAEGALERFAAEHGLRRRHGFVLATGGTWGGYAHVRTAREFLRSLLYQSRDTARHLLQLRSRIDAGKLLVGVIPPPAAPHAGYGAVGPPAGLDAALAGLRAAVGQGWQLLLAGGAALPQSLPRAGLDCIDTAALPRSECSDVLALAQCDLLLRPSSQSDELEAVLSDALRVPGDGSRDGGGNGIAGCSARAGAAAPRRPGLGVGPGAWRHRAAAAGCPRAVALRPRAPAPGPRSAHRSPRSPPTCGSVSR